MVHLTNYTVVGDKSITVLENQVNALLEIGYIPMGGMVVRDEIMWQALALPADQHNSVVQQPEQHTEKNWESHSVAPPDMLPENNEWAKDIADGKNQSPQTNA